MDEKQKTKLSYEGNYWEGMERYGDVLKSSSRQTR